MNESPANNTNCKILPLPYAYSASAERVSVMDNIISKVADFCGYDLSEGGYTKEELWPRIWIALRLLSLVSCWTDSVDDLFIMQTRKQRTTAKQICGCNRSCCKCDEDLIIIPLEFMPLLDNEECMYVGGSISVVVNGIVHRQELDPEYLYQHTDPETGKLYIMRDDFPDILLYRNRCCCLCRRNCTITIEYNAGYENIPNGLLPLICPLLAKIENAKISTSDCASAMTQVIGLLKRKKVGNVEYEWSESKTGTAVTQSLFTDLFDVSLLAELEAISRCDDAAGVEEMGDVI